MLKDLAINLGASLIYDFGKAVKGMAAKNETVQAVLKQLGASTALHDFPERYVESLVELRLAGKDRVVLDFFREESLMQVYYAYHYGGPEERGNEAAHAAGVARCVAALRVGDAVQAARVDVGAEVEHFWEVFRQKVQESKTVKEVELEQRIRHLQATMEDMQQLLLAFKAWMQEAGKDRIQIADKIYNIDRIDKALFLQLLEPLPGQALPAAVPLPRRHKPVPYLYPRPYVGREQAVRRLQAFFEHPQQRFLFLFGTGGMGKSHLLQEVAAGLTVPPVYVRLSQSTNMISLASELGYGEVATLSQQQQRDLFLSKAAAETVPLVFDDFYELHDELVYKTILELSNLSSGKVLLISRALPLDFEGIYIGEERQLELNELLQAEFFVHLQNYHNATGYDFVLTPALQEACWEHCKGYPLGGEFLLKLRALSGEDFGRDIDSIGKIDPASNKRHHDFMKRLLDSILQKGTAKERELARQMAVFMEALPRKAFTALPGFDREAFYALTERKKIFYSLSGDRFGAHALVRTVLEIENGISYEAHAYAGQYYEREASLGAEPDLDSLTKAVYHFEKSQTDNEQEAFQAFLGRWKPKFNFISVKALITTDVKRTIGQLQFRLRLQSDDASAMNELGRAYRRDKQLGKAIAVLEKAVGMYPDNFFLSNELGITYREVGDLQKAIDVLKKAAEAGNMPSMNELGKTYRENGDLSNAIEVLKKAADAGSIQSANELGITYRQAG